MTHDKNNSGTSVKFPFSPQLKILAKALLKDGDEIRLVGGCVRDFLAGRKISDIDLACKYHPEKVMEILKNNKIKCLPTGIKHGTITAIIDRINFEITTLRKDAETFGRHAKVEFVDDYYLDAKRRDFTINAMSIDFTSNLHDYFDGQKDLKNKIVRFIGSAEERITEDYLRILRFFRFSCYYGDSLDEAGLKAAIKFKDRINDLSADRIRNELIKILNCADSSKLIETLTAMQENSVLEPILTAEFSDLKYLKNLLLLEKKLARQFNYLIRFAALVYDHKNQTAKIAKKLNFSNKEIAYINFISNPGFTALNMAKNQLIGLLMEHDEPQHIIDAVTLNLTELKIDDDLINNFLNIQQILTQNKKPEFPVNGDDLLKIGIKPVSIGKALKAGKKYWIENNFVPNKDEIIGFIKTIG